MINYVSTSVAAFFQQHCSFFLRDFITLLPRAGPCSPQRSRVSCERPASSPWRPQWPRPAYQLDILPCRTPPSIKMLRKKATLPPLVLILASSLLLISLAERRSAPPLLTCCSKSTSYWVFIPVRLACFVRHVPETLQWAHACKMVKTECLILTYSFRQKQIWSL